MDRENSEVDVGRGNRWQLWLVVGGNKFDEHGGGFDAKIHVEARQNDL